MRSASTLRETLYYGSDRQQQYWENETQTLRIVRDASSFVWRAYSKRNGVYAPFAARPEVAQRRRSKKAVPLVLTGRSAEEVLSLLRRDYHLHLALEQRLRRWINKASGERVLAFLDPNLGGAPVMTDPTLLYGTEHKKAPYV
ncbi:MAG: hypothetical protein HYZ50_13830 [Deltaproteobacteria bacterium]|nr:hypothetical protein [Deltaproteobacteria bacterium]